MTDTRDQLAAVIRMILDDRDSANMLTGEPESDLAVDLAQALTANGYTHTGTPGLPVADLDAVEANHRRIWFGDGESHCDACGTQWPCGFLLAARGVPTVPCTSCADADFGGDDIRTLPNPSMRHEACASILQPIADPAA